jgi:O-antigen/teichoic acid export membrane protein
MLNKIGTYNKNILILFTGTVASQAIPIAISPILTRLYSPEDFGEYGLLVAIVAIISVIINGSYEQAIVLPDSEEETYNLIGLCFIVSVALSVLTLIGVLLMMYFDYSGFNKPIFFLIPIMVLLNGIFNIVKYFNLRIKEFKNISKALTYKSLISAFIQLLLGLFKPASFNLLLGLLLSNFFSNNILIKSLNIRRKINLISKEGMYKVAKRYNSFLKFQTPISLMNVLSSNFIVFYLNSFFGSLYTGFYTFSNRLLLLPSAVIGTSIGQVFLSEITGFNQSQQHDRISPLVQSTFNKLAFIGVVSYSFLFYFGDELFAFVFGESWRIAGEYAQIMSISLIFIFISAPLSNLYIVFEKQKKAFYFYTILLFARIGLFILSWKLEFDSFKLLSLFTLIDVVYYSIYIYYSFKMSSTNIYKSILYFIGMSVVAFTFWGLLKLLLYA